MNQRWISIIIILLLMIIACGAPVTPPGEVEVATFTSTPLLDMGDLAERTYTPTFRPTATDTPTPTDTSAPTSTIVVPTATVTEIEASAILMDEEEITATPSVTPEEAIANDASSIMAEIPEGGRYFVIQDGAIVGMPNWAHQDVGCAWSGVAGQVFDLAGEPVLDLIVEVGGTLEGELLLGLSLTGMASAYGPGGFEIQIADHVVASQGEAWIQIKDGAGETLSGKTFFETFSDCNQNLLLINFVEVEEIPEAFEVYLPLIIHEEPNP